MREPTSANPVLVEVIRGAIVESAHTGAIAIADTEGRLVLALGDVERPVYPRSAVKALQAHSAGRERGGRGVRTWRRRAGGRVRLP